MKTKFIIWILLFFIPIKGFAETIYDQPYLGEFPEFFRGFSVSAWKKKAAMNLAAIIRQSNLIILAESENISETAESSDRITIYDTNVKILKVFKGKRSDSNLRLNFRAFTTGIEKGSRHIFFLKETKKGMEVLKSSYIYPRGQGFDNHMVLFGSIVCTEDVGIDVIQYLATFNVPNDIDKRLINEYLNQGMYSAVHMASATSPVFGIPVLKMAVSVKDRKRFDIDLYGTAAYGLAIQKNPDNWKLMLENVPSFVGNGRLAESIAFDLAANFGDESTVFVIRDVVAERPELAVSAAFALSKIGGQDAQFVIESWLKNPELSKREEIISNGWNQRKANFSTLIGEALEKMKTRTESKFVAQ